MDFSVDSLKTMASAYLAASAAAKSRVRVAIYVDATATPFLIDAVRGAFVPQTTSALVRVNRLGDPCAPVKEDTDVVLVLSCGSQGLETAVHRLVTAGAPVVVLCESSVEAPFIHEDSPLLGLVAATEEGHLLDALARWILDRTEKDAAFAANFEFMRSAAAGRVIASCSVGNACTALIVWPRGADFPTMTLAQLDMMLKLAGIYGKPIAPERAYEAAGVLAGAYAMRAAARLLTRYTGRAGIAVKALIGGAGSYAVGLGLCALYESDVDYSRVNEAVARAVERARAAAAEVVAGHGAQDAAPLVGIEDGSAETGRTAAADAVAKA